MRRSAESWATWVKLMLALGAQTVAVVYFFGATVAKLETELAWIRQRQVENFGEHEKASVRIEKLYSDFVTHCVEQERSEATELHHRLDQGQTK